MSTPEVAVSRWAVAGTKRHHVVGVLSVVEGATRIPAIRITPNLLPLRKKMEEAPFDVDNWKRLITLAQGPKLSEQQAAHGQRNVGTGRTL